MYKATTSSYLDFEGLGALLFNACFFVVAAIARGYKKLNG